MSWSDAELADAHEGLLDPAVADALAADLATDPQLAARSLQLAEVFPVPLRLPQLEPPAGLEPRVNERLSQLPRDAELADALEGIGDEALLERDPERAAALALPESLPELSPPAGLFGRALARDVDDALDPTHRLHDLVEVLEVVDADGEHDRGGVVVEGADLHVADVRLHRGQGRGHRGERPHPVLEVHR